MWYGNALGRHTALVVVDMQYDFVDKAGKLYISGAEKIVPVINREIIAYLNMGAEIVYTKDWHPNVTPHFKEYGGKWPTHCIAKTMGADFARHLIVAGPTFYKGHGAEDGYSGFRSYNEEERQVVETGLEEYLLSQNIEKIVVCGVATEFCIKETVLDALSHHFEVDVLLDAIKAVNDKDANDAIFTMQEQGAWVRGN